jgi:hypothetical protein
MTKTTRTTRDTVKVTAECYSLPPTHPRQGLDVFEDVPDRSSTPVAALSQKAGIEVDADNAAGLCDRPDLTGCEIANVRADRFCVAVRGDHRTTGEFDDIPESAGAEVRDIHKDTMTLQ